MSNRRHTCRISRIGQLSPTPILSSRGCFEIASILKVIFLQKRPRTFSYYIFYALFLPDTWQIIIGIIAAYLLAPLAMTRDSGAFSRVMLYIMIATIGYTASRLPARGICRIIKKMILGKRQN